MENINDTDFTLLKNYLVKKCGIIISENKRYLFRTRLMPRLKEIGFQTYREFFDLLVSHHDNLYDNIFIESMITTETSFFRDDHPYDTLKNELIPRLLEKKNKISSNPFPRIRIWSVACSTGQEPYSIAMVIADLVENNSDISYNQFSIVATDISNKLLKYAKKGIYKKNEIERGITKELRERHFEGSGEYYRIKNNLKTIINFQNINLVNPTKKMGFFDIIFCRNVLIYFPVELKNKIINNFESHLNDNGILLLGSSESLYEVNCNFKSISSGGTFYYTLT